MSYPFSSISRRKFAKIFSKFSAFLGLGVTAPIGISSNALGNGSSSRFSADKVYDFIIVGSGAGGGPLACNLAINGYQVLVLEAGSRDDDNQKRDIPVLHSAASEDEALSWEFYVNHYQNEQKQQKERKHINEGGKNGVFYPRGSTLGGSTAVNAMITVLPHQEDFDYIAKITGDESWLSFETRWDNPNAPGMIFKYMNRVEKWLPVRLADTSLLFRGRDLLTIVISAIKTQGIFSLLRNLGNVFDSDMLLDPNDHRTIIRKKEGVFQVPVAVGNKKDQAKGVNVMPGNRGSVRDHLLATEKRYPNLTIKTDAFVTKLVFDETGGNNKPKVKGVEVAFGAKLYGGERMQNLFQTDTKTILCDKEVIISAGAFNTPQLLKLSGIGPETELREHGIDVVKDLPGVGTNLQDRYEVPVINQLHEDLSLRDGCFIGEDDDPCLEEFNHNRAAPSIYSTNGGAISIIKKSQEAKENGESPDIYMLGLGGYFDGYTNNYSFTINSVNDAFTWLVLKGHTNNTAGTVTLKSSDPFSTPNINFNYFSEGNDDGRDLVGVVEGIKAAREVMNGASEVVGDEIMPGDEVQTDDEIKKYVERESWGHHASCTCPIGGDSDPMAVLDSKFRVRGISGLRIVDASVFPRIPGFFIALPIFLISEKASDDIIDYWKKA